MQVGIIGLGRLGRSLQTALETANIDVQTGIDAVNAPIVFLCVPDDVIAAQAQTLDLPDPTLLVHCSGALSAAILDRKRAASFHPLQTFPNGESAERFQGCPVFMEGEGLDDLEKLATRIGAVSHRIDAAGKVLYHAAAVMACNQLTALLDAAFELLERSGVRDPKVLMPLIEATMANINEDGTTAALTGPVRRGDAGVVATHLEHLDRAAPETAEIYRALSRRALAMSGDVADPVRRALDDLLARRP